ncbi:hypothetical protein GOP47_0024657 [Adiantum capillus-veneris]|uniref:Uncharacterized protein n=1 Tax=Adiantum capillus-veneris TaxID=13818 RepID=A0A9D4U321_ADICA|nr:hypothetical protein GOP47_0024657 [Adiantum capillus-veneris]
MHEAMKKKSRDPPGVHGSCNPFVMTGQGKAPLASLQAWAEGAARVGSRRLAACITIAGSCLCLYALLLILTSHYPTHWTSLNLCKTPFQSIANSHKRTQLRHLSIGSASSVSTKIATNVSHIVFGIAASSSLWEMRKEYIKLWWKPEKMRGFVWLEKPVNNTLKDERALPPQKVSEDTSKFKYTNKLGMRSAIRISRVVCETYRLGLPNVRWFVMGDDDTIFVTENLVKVLAKYDHRQFYYIGANSESHMQNLAFSYNMAYGGGGFAISYPLAKALHSIQDGCLQRYPALFGSDDRIHACMAELGVPLTKEPGFHQYDIRGNAFGMMTVHAMAPAISLHHMDALDPVFPNKTRLESLKHLKESMETDPTYFLQQSICYDKKRTWSISISWGYAVQIFRGILTPRELEMPSRTFYNWNKRAEYTTFSFNSRAFSRNPCQKPFIFYMHNISTSFEQMDLVESNYIKDNASSSACHWKIESPSSVNLVQVRRHKDEAMWSKVARRKCCHVMSEPSATSSRLQIEVRDCMAEEIATA